MAIYHFIPEEETFEYRLQQRLNGCQTAIIASAFFTFGAFQALKESLLSALKRGARIKFLLGQFDFVTEPRAVNALLKLSSDYPGHLSVYFDYDFGFHYKLAIFNGVKTKAVIIGSSNLTPKGLGAIGEVNLEIIGNRSVYMQALHFIKPRLEKAIKAEDGLREYQIKYNQAKRYRKQRFRWNKTGQNVLTKKNKPVRIFRQPLGLSYIYCWISEQEMDKSIIKNTKNERGKSITLGEHLPDQWIHVNKSFGRQIQEGDLFAVRDDIGYCIGFAICLKKISVLNERDKLETVIFYRYMRGNKVQYRSLSKYKEGATKLGIRDRERLSKELLKRFRSFIKKYR